MNPQYMNQQHTGGGYNPGYRLPQPAQPSQGYGGPAPGPPGPGQPYPQNNMGPPPNSMGAAASNMAPPHSMSAGSMGAPAAPMGAPNGYTGPTHRPIGPPGTYGPPPTKGAGQPPVGGQGSSMPPYSMSNGPASGPPPNQAGPGIRPPSGQMAPQPGPPNTSMGQGPNSMAMPSRPGPLPGAHQLQSQPLSQDGNQLANQMGGMTITGGMPPPLGVMQPPSSAAQSSLPGFPNSTTSHAAPGPPPPHSMSSHGQAAGPPTMAGPPPPQSMSSHGQAAGPPTMAGPPRMSGQQSIPHAAMPPMGGQQPQPGFPQRMPGPPMMSGAPTPPLSSGPPQMSGPGSAYAVGGQPTGPMGYQTGPPMGSMGPPGPMSGPVPNAAPGPPSQYGAAAPGLGGMPPPPSPGGAFPGSQPQGYAPRPGMPNMANAAPTQPQQPRRLDPDQMPSPIQVIEDDRRNRSGEFSTGLKGSSPPLVTTDFMVVDRGNASPRLMRSSMYNIPCTNDMMKQSHLPFVMAISPFARLGPGEQPLPIVDLGELGPVRCNRCKAYMNPYMQFVDGGRRFQCCFCGCATDVPPEYFAHLDHTGRRVDSYDRPELCLGSYEFIATTDYCKNNKLPNAPAYIFMIDVSYNAVKSGLVQLICQHLKDEVLVNLPKEEGMDESEIKVGFVTYAKELCFYNVKGNLAQPQMLVVSDVQDVFVPLLDGFLVKLSESEGVIDSLLAQIPQTFSESRETETVLGPVIEAGLDALKAAECTGKLLIFHTSLPIAEAPGKLKNRDDRKLLGTDKEKTILTPQGTYYTKLGQDCVAAGCGVDLFLFPNSYVDIASMAEVPRLTGGNIFKYSYFQADLDGSRLIEDLKNTIMRPIAFDCITRIRTSTGIRPVDFLGNFYMANTTDVELANMDCDKTITLEIKHDDKLSEAEGAFVQAAMLYTSISGQRRLRIVNMSFNCCTNMADLFRNCELDTLVNYLAKQAIRESLNSNPKAVRENIMNRCAQILGCYRKNCASPSSAGQLILPECMKLLPLYSNCILKSQVQQGAEVSTDDRSYLIHCVNAMSVKDTQVFFYPRLAPLHELDPGIEDPEIPVAIRCSHERLKDSGIYLIDNGLAMWMWIGLNVPTEWVVGLFGVQSAAQIDIDQTRLQDLDTNRSRQIRTIVTKIRQERLRHLKLVIVRQRDKLEPVFQQHLVEDRSTGGSASYVDFLCHIHKEIRSLLS